MVRLVSWVRFPQRAPLRTVHTTPTQRKESGMELVDMLEKGHASTARILAGVSADQLGQPTPCSEWDVRGLVNHIIGGAFFFAAVAETGKPPEGAGGDTDFTAGDMTENYAQAVKADLAAWARPGALEQMCELPFGTMP